MSFLSNVLEGPELRKNKEGLFEMVFLCMQLSKLGVHARCDVNGKIFTWDERTLRIIFLYAFFMTTTFGNMSAKFPSFVNNKKEVVNVFYKYILTHKVSIDISESDKYDKKNYVDENSQFNAKIDSNKYPNESSLIHWFSNPESMSEDALKIPERQMDDLMRFSVNPEFYLPEGIPLLYDLLTDKDINP